MIVCLDSGNTRIKWGVHDGQAWLAEGALLHAEVDRLGAMLAAWPRPERIMLSNVAGRDAALRIREQLAPWQAALHEVKSTAGACGITNLYNIPERLGVDRWCALIGARALFRGAGVVVMAGTATTIDTLDADDRFLGGHILPGIGLMLRSLASGTAALPFAEGRYATSPRCTDDAIVSGVIEAQAGAIERAWRRLGDEGAACLVSGGYADHMVSHLVIPCRLTHNLPLEGLRRIADEIP